MKYAVWSKHRKQENTKGPLCICVPGACMLWSGCERSNGRIQVGNQKTEGVPTGGGRETSMDGKGEMRDM